MTKTPFPASATRDELAQLLLTRAYSGSTSAARTLINFAQLIEQDELEALLLDQSLEPWIRTFALRAFDRQQISLSERAFVETLQQFSPDSPYSRGPYRFDGLTNLALMMFIARTPETQSFAVEWIQRADPELAGRILLKNERPPRERDSGWPREALHQRWYSGEQRDLAVAWATFDQPPSQQLVFSEPLEFGKLGRAVRRLTRAEIDQLFDSYPEEMMTATRALCLPPGITIEKLGADEARDLAIQMVEDLAERPEAREEDPLRKFDPLITVSELENAAEILDDLARSGLPESLHRHACQIRFRCDPTPELSSFSEETLAWILDFASRRPSEEYRELYRWGLHQQALGLQQAGARSLTQLGDEEANEVARMDHEHSHPLVRLICLGPRARRGDEEARSQLIQAATDADHVVLRAQAIRSLVDAGVAPLELLLHAVSTEQESFDRFYDPVQCESAVGLARGGPASEKIALPALVRASVELKIDDAWWALEGAIRSWLEDRPATIYPVWYWIYARGVDEEGGA